MSKLLQLEENQSEQCETKSVFAFNANGIDSLMQLSEVSFFSGRDRYCILSDRELCLILLIRLHAYTTIKYLFIYTLRKSKKVRVSHVIRIPL